MLELRLCWKLFSARGSLIRVLLVIDVILVSLRWSISWVIDSILSYWIHHWLKLIKLRRIYLIFEVLLDLSKSRVIYFLNTIGLLKILEKRVHVTHHVVQFIVYLLEI